MNRRLACSAASVVLAMTVAAPDGQGAEAGRDVAATCAACHGTDGRSRGGVPALAGRDKDELVRAMRDFRDGRRASTIMQQLAKGYSDSEIEAAAAYFAARKAP
ncbi:MAG TPA: c-type cytochrome [Casimicrobiaceae bacterium]|nr:c-type cytochrome [Casimicrobiaceae bacterium]